MEQFLPFLILIIEQFLPSLILIIEQFLLSLILIMEQFLPSLIFNFTISNFNYWTDFGISLILINLMSISVFGIKIAAINGALSGGKSEMSCNQSEI